MFRANPSEMTNDHYSSHLESCFNGIRYPGYFSALMPVRSLCSIIMLLIPGIIHAQDMIACTEHFIPAEGSYDFRETSQSKPLTDKQIRNIYITRLPIFNEEDPKENNRLFRFANRFHILTSENNISQQLLFSKGEVYNQQLVEESARLLRELDHLYDASIRTISSCDDHVDLEVITRDVWSLNLDVSLDRSGGESDHRFGISEGNLFGSGKQLSIISQKDSDRKTNELSYKDNNLFGSRVRANISYSNNDDGSSKVATLRLPFFALDSKFAWGVQVQDTERIDTQYFLGDDISEINHEITDYSIHVGFSSGKHNNVSRRRIFGLRHIDSSFSESDELPPPAQLPINKKMSYPYFQYEAVEDYFTTVFNLDQIHRTEDLHLGTFFRGSIGLASTEFGSDQDRLVVSGEFRDALYYDKKILLRHRFEWHGIWNQDTDTTEDVILDYTINYFRSQTDKRSFFAQLSSVWTENLNTNQQIVLGGSTGLRGYDRRLQTGDRRVVLTIEERQYTNIHLFNLAWLGFAAFIDIGRAWEPGVDDGLDSELLANIGFGIRLASSKADAGRIVHIDFAFPMTNRNDPNVDDIQVAVKVKNSL